MKLLHRYIFQFFLKNFSLSLLCFVLLFLLFDFFDRIDNVIGQGASLLVIVQYFVLKIPLIMSLMLPVSVLVASIMTIGLLSKNSELTAMRASGCRVLWLCRPIFISALVVSLFSIVLNETIVPYSQRRVREIYNIDIRQKHKTGTYNQTDFWWRDGENFYSVDIFDSRSNRLYGFSQFQVDESFQVQKRVNAADATWLTPSLGWTLSDVREYVFPPEGGAPSVRTFSSLPLPISDSPQDFYNAETDPHAMSYLQLSLFIEKLERNGVNVSGYLSELYGKLSFPFISLIVALAAIPFALLPARTGSMARSLIAALLIGFSYYVIHSMSIAMGRAEFWPPMIAAWMANIVLGLVAFFLNAGAESPS